MNIKSEREGERERDRRKERERQTGIPIVTDLDTKYENERRQKIEEING